MSDKSRREFLINATSGIGAMVVASKGFLEIEQPKNTTRNIPLNRYVKIAEGYYPPDDDYSDVIRDIYKMNMECPMQVNLRYGDWQ